MTSSIRRALAARSCSAVTASSLGGHRLGHRGHVPHGETGVLTRLDWPGVDALESGAGPLGRARREGGGRKRLADTDPGLVPALLALVEADERGDPMTPLRWTTKSTRNLAGELTAAGHPVSADTVDKLLHE